MSRANVFIALCFSFIIGLSLNSFIQVPVIFYGIFLILGLAFVSVFWIRSKKMVVLGFCLIILAAGIYREQTAQLKVAKNELRAFNDKKQEIVLTGMVIKEPDIRADKVQLTIGHVRLFENNPFDIKGKILVTTDKYAGYQYGDKLKIIGKLKTPAVFEDFSYQDYLAKDGIYSVSYWPKIELIAKGEGNFVYSKILSFKNKLRTSIHKFLKPPQSTILAAMMLGDKRSMTDDLKEKLNIIGLRHITAISGMHITILSGILIKMFIGLGFWRRQAFYLGLGFLFLFILMIGAPASAVRAGVMGGLLLLAEKVGRVNQAWRGLIFVAALMLLINPLLLRLDVGFQLSFLAVLGIICFSSFFIKYLKFLPKFLKIRQAGAMTLSAQLFALPILIYNFGQFSLVAPLTNILVVPLLPYILMSGFFGGLVSLFLPFSGVIVFLPVWLILSYLGQIINWFSTLPFSAVVLKDVHWIYLIVYYAVIWISYRYLKAHAR